MAFRARILGRVALSTRVGPTRVGPTRVGPQAQATTSLRHSKPRSALSVTRTLSVSQARVCAPHPSAAACLSVTAADGFARALSTRSVTTESGPGTLTPPKEVHVTIPSAIGESRFEDMRREGQFYVDKTAYAPKLLQYKRAVLLRPPRMGKTLFLTMLDCLFDVRHREHFDELFGGLHAHAHPRDEFNSFHVLTITLPCVAGDLGDYKAVFHTEVLSCVVQFLRDHPDVLAQTNKDLDSFRDRFKDDSSAALSEIAGLVPRGKLVILVDEYDRAPMDAYANRKDLEVPAGTQNPVWDMLKGFLAKLKALAASHGARYYVTGIFTVPGLKLSIFNGSDDLTHTADFAGAFGMTEGDVRRGLHAVAGVTDATEIDRAVAFVREHANGYYFFRAEEALFNPQLMHRFLQDYRPEGYAEKLPSKVVDSNQVFSSNGLRIASHDLALTRRLLDSCAADASFRGAVATTSDDLDPITYLFQLGVLSLANSHICYDGDSEVDLLIPNLSVRRNYAREFLRFRNGVPGSATAFLADPTVVTLQSLLDGVTKASYRWTNQQCEADFQTLLAAEFIFSSPITPGMERAAGGSKRKIDLRVITETRVIVIELKTVRGFIAQKHASQSLTEAPTEDLALTTTRVGQEYPHEGLVNLAAMAEDDVMALKVKYGGTKGRCDTVAAVHRSAEEQVAEYAELERAACGSGNETGQGRTVLAFAVTQVVNRFVVTDATPP